MWLTDLQLTSPAPAGPHGPKLLAQAALPPVRVQVVRVASQADVPTPPPEEQQERQRLLALQQARQQAQAGAGQPAAQQQQQQQQAAGGEAGTQPLEVDEWLVDFANLFREISGVDPDRCAAGRSAACLDPGGLAAGAALGREAAGRELAPPAPPTHHQHQHQHHLRHRHRWPPPPPTPRRLPHARRHVDFHNAGWEATSKAMEATVHSDRALPIFGKAIERFQEVTCSGLLNWGNVHTCIAHKYMDEAAAAGAPPALQAPQAPHTTAAGRGLRCAPGTPPAGRVQRLLHHAC